MDGSGMSRFTPGIHVAEPYSCGRESGRDKALVHGELSCILVSSKARARNVCNGAVNPSSHTFELIPSNLPRFCCSSRHL